MAVACNIEYVARSCINSNGLLLSLVVRLQLIDGNELISSVDGTITQGRENTGALG